MADTDTQDMAAAKAARDAKDPRPDIVQEVEARSDALARGEGGPEPAMLKDDDTFSGNAGTGGVVKNQDMDQQ